MNAITKGRFALRGGLSVLALIILVAPTAFAYAQYADDGGCCDTGWYDTGSSYTVDTGWYDTGSSYTPDTGWYDTGSSYTPDTGWYDTGYGYTPDTGWYDTGYGYTPDTGWYDTGYGYTPSTGWYDTGSSYTPVNYSTYSQAPSYVGSSGQTYYPSTGYSYTTGTSNPVSHSTSYPGVTFRPVSIGTATPVTRTTTTQSTPQTQTQTQTQSQNLSNTNVNYTPNTNTNINNNNVTVNVPAQSAPTYTYQQPIVQPVQYIYQQPTYQIAPSCTISIVGGANGYGYGTNQLATLSWSAQNASSAYISPNVGSVALSGTRVVYPVNGGTYTMTVYGYNGQTVTCQTPAYYVAPIMTAPEVSLSQIPYTGFDFGTTGNMIYWMSLIAFALAAGYLMVYYRGGALAFAGSMLGSDASETSKEVAYTIPARVVIQKKVDTIPVAPKIIDLPVAADEKVTVDSMSVATTDSGMPRIVINRN